MKPIIVLVDNEKDLADRLLDALRENNGCAPRIFVRDHATCGDTVVALLPPDAPSLAAALRAWVDSWWSDGDEDEYGSPETYLQGFGVTIAPGEFSSFATSCPYCQADDELEVADGTFYTTGVFLLDSHRPHG